MPTLIAQNTDYRMRLETGVRSYWLVGRDPSCELLLTDDGISRCHATIVHLDDRFYVIDHSLNGTHILTREEEIEAVLAADIPEDHEDADVVGFETCEVKSADLRVPILTDAHGADLHRSHQELQLVQRRSEVPRMVGYSAHAISSPDLMDRMLESFRSLVDLETLASMGRRVHPGNVLLFIGFDRHLFKFEG